MLDFLMKDHKFFISEQFHFKNVIKHGINICV